MSGVTVENINKITKGVCDVNITDHREESPLHLLVKKNGDDEKHLKSMKLLLSAGADVNAKDKQDKTPLYLAVKAERTKKIIKALLSAGADANVKDKRGKTPLYLAVKAYRPKEIIEALIDGGADLEMTYTDEGSRVNGTILLHAIIPIEIHRSASSYTFEDFQFSYINAEITKLLIDKAARIKSAGENVPGCSPILAAALFCRTEIVKHLLKHISIKEVNVDSVSSQNSFFGNFRNRKNVIIRFPPYDSTGWDIIGFAALHLSIFHSDLDMATALIEAGADRNIQDADGKTPLHLAIKEDKHEFVELLVNGCVETTEKSKHK